MRKIKKLLVVFVVIAVAAAGFFYYYQKREADKNKLPEYRVELVKRGNIVESISATGTLEPEELVDVGAQVGGMVAEFGKDANGKEINYGSVVKSGDMLARIDDSLYSATLRQSEAQLQQAKANFLSAQAQLQQQKARHMLAVNNYERAKTLRPNKVITQTEYDTAESELAVTAANVAAAEASIEQCKASISSAEAGRDSAKRNLGYCTIKSPVDGVIIDRRVNIGQTVVSSMSAPSLFLIAKDLRRMQIWVSVNEADIGSIEVGQKVWFTVDAFPGQRFRGKVIKIRLNASMSQNVVTYVVEVETDNSDGKLLPYLTAGVNFIIDERRDVLRIPATALRFIPDAAQVPEDQKELYNEIVASRANRRGGGAPRKSAVWVLKNGKVQGIMVTPGLSDGVYTELVAGDLPENAAVITGVQLVSSAAKDASASGEQQTTNPFLPKAQARGRR